MSSYGHYSHYEDGGIPWKSFIAIIVLFLFTGYLLGNGPPSQSQLLQEGKITEEQYCQDYADYYRIPARCYKYFGIPINVK